MTALAHAIGNPGLEFPALFLLGVLDGINPCAFSTLLVWLGMLWKVVAEESFDDGATLRIKRRRIVAFALIYALAMGAVYGVFGLGWQSARQLIPPTWATPMTQLVGLIVVGMGVLLLRDALRKDKAPLIHMPKRLHRFVKDIPNPTNPAAAAVGGGIIGLCSVPCSGIVYLGVLNVLDAQPFGTRMISFGVYLLGFIAPVLVSASVLSSRAVLTRLGRFAIRSRPKVRWAMALLVMLIGVVSIWVA